MYANTIGNHAFIINMPIKEHFVKYLITDFFNYGYETNEIDVIRNSDYPNSCRIIHKKWTGIIWKIKFDTIVTYGTIDEGDPESIQRKLYLMYYGRLGTVQK